MQVVYEIFDYVVTFGRPEIVLSDNGSQFKAHIFNEFNRMLGIKLRNTTNSTSRGKFRFRKNKLLNKMHN